MPFVVDASATLPWCFPDEATASTETLLDRVAAGEQIIVPAHWLTEVSNSLLMAMRRKRIDRDRAERFLDQLAALRMTIDRQSRCATPGLYSAHRTNLPQIRVRNLVKPLELHLIQMNTFRCGIEDSAIR